MATPTLFADGGGTTGTGNRSMTGTPAVGSLVVVYMALSGNTNASMTCSDNRGGSYYLAGTALFNTGADIMGVFVRTTRTSSSTSHVITVDSGANTSGYGIAYAVPGMAKTGSAAVRSIGSVANQTTGVPTVTMSNAALAENLVIGTVGASTNLPGVTDPSGWTARINNGVSDPPVGIDSSSLDSGYTSAVVTWGSTVNSGSAYCAFALELDTSPSAVYVGEPSAWVESVPVPIGRRGAVLGDPFNMTIMGPAFRANADRTAYLERVLPRTYSAAVSGNPLWAHVSGSFDDSITPEAEGGYIDIPDCEVGDLIHATSFFTWNQPVPGAFDIYLRAIDDQTGTPTADNIAGTCGHAIGATIAAPGGGATLYFDRVPHRMTGVWEVAVAGTTRITILFETAAGSTSQWGVYQLSLAATRFPVL